MKCLVGACLALLLCDALQAQVGDPKKREEQSDFDGLKALKHPDPDVRFNAAVPALLATLKSDDVLLIEPFVLGTLGKIGEGAVPNLIEALTAKEYRLRYGAAYALALIGPAAADAVEPLAKALAAPEPDLRGMAARAPGKIGPQAKA